MGSDALRQTLREPERRKAARLGWLALVLGIALVAATVMRRWADATGVLVIDDAAAIEVSWTLAAVLSFALHLAWRSEAVAPETLLKLGLVYEIGLAFAVALAEQLLVGPMLTPRLSMAALVVLAFPLVVPGRPFGRVAATAASFLMLPLAVEIAGALGHPTAQGAERLVILAPTFAAAVLGLAAARIVHGRRARRAGSYELIERIGGGGMGDVWRARHRILRRPAAVKVVRPERLVRDAERTLERFEREAQTTACLRSPHVVSLYDFGVTADGGLYYAMELLDGVDLEQLVLRDGPLPAARVAKLLRQIGAALAEAHARGLVHRDIKPSNLVVGRVGIEDDFLKVLDFGLVELRSAVPSAAGTPAYMAPEVIVGEPIDGRTDLYSAGAVAYWLLTGELVFDGESIREVAEAHLTRTPVPPSARGVAVPEALETIVMRLLEKSPTRRFESAVELVQELDEADRRRCAAA